MYHLVGVLMVGEAMRVWGQRGYRITLYLPLNFNVDLKLFLEISSIF